MTVHEKLFWFVLFLANFCNPVMLASPPDRSGPRRAFSPILFEELRLQKPKIHIFDHLQLQMPQH